MNNQIKTGDIITVLQPRYIDYTGGKYQDHFTSPAPLHLLVKSEPTNNGNIKAVDSKNRLRWIAEKDVIQVKHR